MKVLHITNNYPTRKYPIFGIFVKEQINSLTKLGIKNDVFFINGREKGIVEYFRSIIILRRLLFKQCYDVIHCHHALSALCFVLSGHSKKNKSIVSYQNHPFNEQGEFLYHFIKKRFNAIILKNYSDKVDNFSVFYQPNGVDTSFFKPITQSKCIDKLNLNRQKRYILFVSSNYFRKQKRYDRFKKIIIILREKYKVMDIEELTLINTERSLVPYYFNAASLHVITSDFEGSPNSVKEAMACNTPVVSTNVGDVKKLLSGIGGYYVSDTKDVEELADLSYRSLQYSKALFGRKSLAEKMLDIESVAKNIIEIYKKI